jgi:hypothetical protein
MTPNEQDAWRARLRRRLTVITEDDRPSVRLAAIRAVQSMLPNDDALARESPESLLRRVLVPWSKRAYRGGGPDRQVTRPPLSLMDVWQL